MLVRTIGVVTINQAKLAITNEEIDLNEEEERSSRKGKNYVSQIRNNKLRKMMGLQSTLDLSLFTSSNTKGVSNHVAPSSQKGGPIKKIIKYCIVFWNNRGMGSICNEEAVKKLLKMVRPSILLIQQNKLQGKVMQDIGKKQWR